MAEGTTLLMSALPIARYCCPENLLSQWREPAERAGFRCVLAPGYPNLLHDGEKEFRYTLSGSDAEVGVYTCRSWPEAQLPVYAPSIIWVDCDSFLFLGRKNRRLAEVMEWMLLASGALPLNRPLRHATIFRTPCVLSSTEMSSLCPDPGVSVECDSRYAFETLDGRSRIQSWRVNAKAMQLLVVTGPAIDPRQGTLQHFVSILPAVDRHHEVAMKCEFTERLTVQLESLGAEQVTANCPWGKALT